MSDEFLQDALDRYERAGGERSSSPTARQLLSATARKYVAEARKRPVAAVEKTENGRGESVAHVAGRPAAARYSP